MRMLSRQCPTCIFAPGNRMRLNPGRLKEMVDSCLSTGGFVICHQTLPDQGEGVLGAACRGFADRYDTQQLQIAERLGGGFLYVDPPDNHQEGT
jgi:hypothetical protein